VGSPGGVAPGVKLSWAVAPRVAQSWGDAAWAGWRSCWKTDGGAARKWMEELPENDSLEILNSVSSTVMFLDMFYIYIYVCIIYSALTYSTPSQLEGSKLTSQGQPAQTAS